MNLQINKNNVNVSFNNYLDTIDTLIIKHASIKKVNKKQEISSETMVNQEYSELNTKEKQTIYKIYKMKKPKY